MHGQHRLISLGSRHGKHYSSAIAARLNTGNEGRTTSLPIPSAKSWARPQQPMISPAVAHPLAIPSNAGLPLRKDWDKRIRDEPNQIFSQPKKRSVDANVTTSTVKNLGKWAASTPNIDPKASHAVSGSSKSFSSAKEDLYPSTLVKWSLASHARTSPVSKPSFANPDHSSFLSTSQNSSFRIDSGKGLKNASLKADSSASKASSKTSSKYDNSPYQSDYSPHVSRGYDDPRRASRRNRDFYARNDHHGHHRREEINKLPVKRAVKPKSRGIAVRRTDIFIPTNLTVAMLARLLNVKLSRLLNMMRRVGMNVEANYDYILSADYAALLAEEFGFNPIIDDEAAFDIYPPKPHPIPSSLPLRPPIITIMGHVDHGKTTLLDTLRSASVAKGEAGGITQHIGAFSVPVANTDELGPRSITFLDTPGHAAFSAMRARGANVTDIVVLVVAADDGVMPQTKEVINLLKKDNAQVDLVIAINKVDKPGANPDTVKKALLAHGIELEDFGGDIPAVHVSGLTGLGLPDLLETLSALAEVQDLRAEQDGPVHGHVIESHIHKGLGSVTTVLIRRGCLKVGSYVISGTAHGKVRRMADSSGKTVQSALPGMAVTVSGWKTLPKAGDEVFDGPEGDIKRAVANRLRRLEAEALQEDAEAINESRRQEREARAEGEGLSTEPISISGPNELRLLIKADVSGSCEALEGTLNGIGNHIAISRVISTGVGDITESDILLAKAADATIIGFSVSASRTIQSLAARNDVPVSTGNVIYHLMDDVRSRVIDMLPKTIETKVTGEATVLQLFDITSKAKQLIKVAGCRVTNGLIEKQKYARVIRLGQVVHEGSLDTMRQLKKDITEARKGTECGLSFRGYSDLQEGDIIQMYEKIEKPGVI